MKILDSFERSSIAKLEELAEQLIETMEAFSELFTNAVAEADKAFSAIYEALHALENDGMDEVLASQKRAQRLSRKLLRGRLATLLVRTSLIFAHLGIYLIK